MACAVSSISWEPVGGLLIVKGYFPFTLSNAPTSPMQLLESLPTIKLAEVQAAHVRLPGPGRGLGYGRECLCQSHCPPRTNPPVPSFPYPEIPCPHFQNSHLPPSLKHCATQHETNLCQQPRVWICAIPRCYLPTSHQKTLFSALLWWLAPASQLLLQCFSYLYCTFSFISILPYPKDSEQMRAYLKIFLLQLTDSFNLQKLWNTQRFLSSSTQTKVEITWDNSYKIKAIDFKMNHFYGTSLT